jgi:hypothetical protein
MFHHAKRHASPEQDACANAWGDSIPFTFRQRSFMPRPVLFLRQILLPCEPLQGDFVMEI